MSRILCLFGHHSWTVYDVNMVQRYDATRDLRYGDMVIDADCTSCGANKEYCVKGNAIA